MQELSETQKLYLGFVGARHGIWSARQEGLPQEEWTTDPVLRSYKFTNVFRILDHGSQFLLGELLDDPEQDFHTTLFRAFLYRYNNRPEPWEYFRSEQGHYPTIQDLADGTLRRTWQEFKDDGRGIFGNAYRMFVGKENTGKDRLTWLMDLTDDYFVEKHFSEKVGDMMIAGAAESVHQHLKLIPRCADFMAMQILTDLQYSPFGSRRQENSFVVAGPGSRLGAWHVFNGEKALYAIHWAQEMLMSTEYGVDVFIPMYSDDGEFVKKVFPSLMDLQNTFCEFGKYMRYRVKPEKSYSYRVAHPGKQNPPLLPSHWRVGQ